MSERSSATLNGIAAASLKVRSSATPSARERDRPPRIRARHEVAGADVLVDLSAEEVDIWRVRLRPERREVLDGLGDDVKAVAPVAKEDGDVAEVVDGDAGAAAGGVVGRSVRGHRRVAGGGAR